MLNIKDLTANKELDSKDMTCINGGTGLMQSPLAILLDGSTSIRSKVADVSQAFGLGLGQNNAGAVTNNQAIAGGNGIVYAPVDQNLSQSNWMDVSGLGNISI